MKIDYVYLDAHNNGVASNTRTLNGPIVFWGTRDIFYYVTKSLNGTTTKVPCVFISKPIYLWGDTKTSDEYGIMITNEFVYGHFYTGTDVPGGGYGEFESGNDFHNNYRLYSSKSKQFYPVLGTICQNLKNKLNLHKTPFVILDRLTTYKTQKKQIEEQMKIN